MRVVSIAALVLSMGLALPALSQPTPNRAALHVKKDTDAPQVKVIQRGGRTVYKFIKGLVLYGKAHRPHAVLLIDRDHQVYEARQPTRSLGFRITEAIRRSPF